VWPCGSGASGVVNQVVAVDQNTTDSGCTANVVVVVDSYRVPEMHIVEHSIGDLCARK